MRCGVFRCNNKATYKTKINDENGKIRKLKQEIK